MAMPGQANNAVFSLWPGVDEEAVRKKIKENFKNRGLKLVIKAKGTILWLLSSSILR